jgi:expansin (peptidoglycan-binding protein)
MREILAVIYAALIVKRGYASVLGFLALLALTVVVLPVHAAIRPMMYLPMVMSPAESTLVPGLPFDPTKTQNGEGTFYDFADGGGNCSFTPTPSDLMVGAMNNADYTNAWLCGAYVEITGPKGVVTVRIVDRCPECKPGDIDLSPQAFARIADLPQGRVPISWHLVSPPLNSPIVYQFKEGSNEWWTAVQIRNHRNPIWRVEFRAEDGSFKQLPRVDYNYFIGRVEEGTKMGPGPYTLRVTDIFGNTLTDTGIPLVENGEVRGSKQFPAAP